MTYAATSHGRAFKIVEGTTHPAYSLNCFDTVALLHEISVADVAAICEYILELKDKR